MIAQTVTVQVDQVTAQILEILKAQAEAQGSTLASLLQPLVGNGTMKQKAEMTPKEKAQAFEEWVNTHSISVSHFVDDSRESVYTREDEAL